MSQSSSLKSDAASAFTILPEFAAAKAATMELNQSFKTKLVSFRSFIRKTTTSKDEVRASIRCIGRCIDNMEISLNDYEVIVEDKVDRPEVSSSEDLSHDQLRSNATLLLKYFKNRTLEYFFAAFFPPDITHVDDAMAQFGLIRSHLENCRSQYRAKFQPWEPQWTDLSHQHGSTRNFLTEVCVAIQLFSFSLECRFLDTWQQNDASSLPCYCRLSPTRSPNGVRRNGCSTMLFWRLKLLALS